MGVNAFRGYFFRGGGILLNYEIQLLNCKEKRGVVRIYVCVGYFLSVRWGVTDVEGFIFQGGRAVAHYALNTERLHKRES